MPVRRNKKRKYWEVDVTVRLKDGSKVQIKRRSPHQSREGARDYERYLVREILAAMRIEPGAEPKTANLTVSQGTRTDLFENRVQELLASDE